MQDAVRQALQETQANFEALAASKNETGRGKQDTQATKGPKHERGDTTRRQEMRPQENPYQDYKLKANRYGDGWGDYAPGFANAEEQELETIIAGQDASRRNVGRRLGRGLSRCKWLTTARAHAWDGCLRNRSGARAFVAEVLVPQVDLDHRALNLRRRGPSKRRRPRA